MLPTRKMYMLQGLLAGIWNMLSQWVNRSKMASFVIAIWFSILPCGLVHGQLIAVAIKQFPTSRTNPAIMLTNGSNFLLIDSRGNAVGILPPGLDRLHDHQATVICVTGIFIRETRAPKRFCEWYITMRPDPVSFMAYKRRFQKYCPLQLGTCLSQAIGTWILIMLYRPLLTAC